ncbi:RHS repeat protein, partial [Oryzibacter oryziterrae]|uniref:RHS repeat protein n=1 Tax=Oryzibacter oryziterrae TaxID=2766474 RepID=UPI001F1A61E7
DAPPPGCSEKCSSTLTGGDERTTATDYVYNTAKWIVNLPRQVLVYDGVGTGGTLLQGTGYYYDGATSMAAMPSEGDLTSTYVFTDATTGYRASTLAYDSFGNLVSKANATGDLTTIDYETTYSLYPIKTTVSPSNTMTSTDPAVSQKTLTAWNYTCAKPASTRDLNWITTTYDYDVFCREVKRTTGDVGSNYVKTEYSALNNPGGQSITTSRNSMANNSAGNAVGEIVSRSYLDGFGRTVRSVSEGVDASHAVIVETNYHKRGGVRQVSLPYFGTDNSGPTPAGLNYSYTFTDVLDRPVRSQTPNWIQTNYAYTAVTTGLALDQVTTTETIDDKGTANDTTDDITRKTVVIRDGYGRTLSTSEYGSSSGTLTTKLTWDDLGHLIKVTDPAGNVWSAGYDMAGRRTKVDDPDLGLWTFTYDNAGRVLTQ